MREGGKEGERERGKAEIRGDKQDIADNMWENPFKSMECFIKAVML